MPAACPPASRKPAGQRTSRASVCTLVAGGGRLRRSAPQSTSSSDPATIASKWPSPLPSPSVASHKRHQPVLEPIGCKTQAVPMPPSSHATDATCRLRRSESDFNATMRNCSSGDDGDEVNIYSNQMRRVLYVWDVSEPPHTAERAQLVSGTSHHSSVVVGSRA